MYEASLNDIQRDVTNSAVSSYRMNVVLAYFRNGEKFAVENKILAQLISGCHYA